MATCPLCEHAQATGDECQVCGHKLTGPGTDMAPVAPLAGLEPTRMEAVEVAAETVPDLEPTRMEAVAVPPEDSGWVDAMRAGPVQEGVADPVPGLEHHRAEPLPDEGPALDPLAPVVCRYCRSTAMPGDRFCGRCGMRLARFEPVRMAGAERGELVCRDCGSLGAGPRCRRCGARMVEPG